MSDDAQGFELTPEMITQAHVLVVDDDALVTTTLRNFLSLDLDLEPATFNDPAAALEHARRNPLDLVISDFLMPKMNGIQLLTELRKLHPEAPRVLLTGYADKENAIRAINEVRLFHYIEKPWDNGQLRSVVLNGLERRFLRRMLAARMEELTATREDLAGLRRALVRAFG